jgi:phage terminase small subunit
MKKQNPYSLTDRQLLFCDLYLANGMNATQAALDAGYSEKTAKEIGCENLTKPNIALYISEKQGKVAEKLNVTFELVVEQYRRLGFYDIRKLFDKDDSIKRIADIDDETSVAVSSVEVEEIRRDGAHIGYTKKIKFTDKKGALDSLCKVLGYNAPTKVAETDSEGKDKPRLDETKLIEALNIINNG